MSRRFRFRSLRIGYAVATFFLLSFHFLHPLPLLALTHTTPHLEKSTCVSPICSVLLGPFSVLPATLNRARYLDPPSRHQSGQPIRMRQGVNPRRGAPNGSLVMICFQRIGQYAIVSRLDALMKSSVDAKTNDQYVDAIRPSTGATSEGDAVREKYGGLISRVVSQISQSGNL